MNNAALRSHRVPAQRVYRGACPRRVSETSVYALARDHWSRGLKVWFRLEGGHLFFVSPKKRYDKKGDPMSAPNNHLSVIVRFPALLGRGGRFRQAIPGLSKTASASLPRPRLRADIPPRPAMLGAARRGGESKAKAQPHQKQSPNIHLRHSRAGGNPDLAACAATTPHPNPPPKGRGDSRRGIPFSTLTSALNHKGNST